MNKGKTQVTIVTGFLGAGKTTLVNKLLNTSQEKIGVIVNEFGEVGIDGEIIYADENAIIEIRNGCVCCTVRTDLVAGVKDLLSRTSLEIDRLIVETSGLADPAPVLQTFLADAEIMAIAELESVITVVDVATFHKYMDDEIAKEQIIFADVIVLSKIDQFNPSLLRPLETYIKSANPFAEILGISTTNEFCNSLLGKKRFSLPNLLSIEPDILTDEHDHEHDQTIQSISLETTHTLDPDSFSKWATRISLQSRQPILRMKGVLDFKNENRQFYFHSVYMLTDCKPGKPWQVTSPRKSRLVVIGRNLDENELRTGFESCIYELNLA